MLAEETYMSKVSRLAYEIGGFNEPKPKARQKEANEVVRCSTSGTQRTLSCISYCNCNFFLSIDNIPRLSYIRVDKAPVVLSC